MYAADRSKIEMKGTILKRKEVSKSPCSRAVTLRVFPQEGQYL
jgi:hypothetical protein